MCTNDILLLLRFQKHRMGYLKFPDVEAARLDYEKAKTNLMNVLDPEFVALVRVMNSEFTTDAEEVIYRLSFKYGDMTPPELRNVQ